MALDTQCVYYALMDSVLSSTVVTTVEEQKAQFVMR